MQVQSPEKEKDVPLDAKAAASADCRKEVASRTIELMDRITVYFGVCALDEKHASFIEEGDGTFTSTISEEGQALLCAEACRDHADLAAEAPDCSALLEACGETAKKEIKIIRVHDAFDAARKTCPSEEAPLIDVEDDLGSNVEDGLGSNVGGHVEADVTNDVVDEQVRVEPTVVVPQVVEPEVVDVLPGNSPKAPFKGNRIKQQTFEYEMKNALAERNDGNCDKLKQVFKKCDYKGTGKVYIAQIDNMLDKLDSQKVETMDLLHQIAVKVKKDPAQDPLTFKDWTRFKLDSLEAAKCALEYATRK
jgi:hypothetical protein